MSALYLKTSSFYQVGKDFRLQLTPKSILTCVNMTYPPAKFDVDWSKEIQVIVRKLMCDLKLMVLASWQELCSPIDPQINCNLCLNVIYPPAKCDVNWLKEINSSYCKNNLMIDVCPPAQPPTFPI